MLYVFKVLLSLLAIVVFSEVARPDDSFWGCVLILVTFSLAVGISVILRKYSLML